MGKSDWKGTEMNPTKCPHCGAELLDEHIESNYFGCGSTEWYRPGHARYLFERGNDCYERQIATLIQDRDAWKLAAQQCGIYRADTPHDTPELWQSSQLKAITNMMNQIAALKDEVAKAWHEGAEYGDQSRFRYERGEWFEPNDEAFDNSRAKRIAEWKPLPEPPKE